MKAVSVVAFAVLLHGCGGGGSSPVTTAPGDTPPPAGPMIAGETVPSGTTITLPAGTDAPTVTFSAGMDETVTVPDIGTFTCVSADGCSVAVADDVITTTGDIEVVSLDVTDAGILAQLVAAVAEPTEPTEPTEPPGPTDLEIVQADAVTAAKAAGTAATAAKTASDAALAARKDRAVFQTGDLSGGNSGMLAHSAYMQAKAAATAATAAQEASDAAAEAMDVATATRALVMAETARDNAVTAQGLAETHRNAAVMASTTEVKVVEKTKTVGPVDDQTSIKVDGIAKSRTIDKVTRHTGLIRVATDPNVALTTPGVKDVHGRLVAPVDDTGEAVTVTRMAATPSIGVTYDSDDDTARLTLITAYLGSEKQMQFVRVDQDPANPFTVTGGEVGAPILPEPGGSDRRGRDRRGRTC